ncbi:MAG: cytochrome c3 family protein [Gemmataceae bacterium]
MPSPLRDTKTLPQWFELDYFRRRRLFRGLWRSSAGIALLVSCLGVGWTLLAGKQTVYQAGPLSTAHASFNRDCRICHTEAFPVWNRLWTSDAAVRSVKDDACEQCHAGPLHHECVAQLSCASCHHEHRGHPALARITDNQCTLCHADLKCDKGKATQFVAHITGFTSQRHPEFRLWRDGSPTDPGTLRFNHKVHLQDLLDIDRKQWEARQQTLREAGVTLWDVEKPKKQVRLDCQSCHQMDEAGRYIMPINFERHCQECHPLSVQLMGDWQGPLRETAFKFGSSPAPHPVGGETAEAVRAALRERLTRFILHDQNKPLLGEAKPQEPLRQLPGWISGAPVPSREFAWVNQQLEQIEHVLFDGGGGCKHCHQEKTNPSKRPNGLPIYQPLGMLGVNKAWYEHSVFSHNSHKSLRCEQCHEDASRSEKASDVLLPRLETCLRCHNEGREVSARTDCVECHIYHDPKLKRQFKGNLTIEQLLGK